MKGPFLYFKYIAISIKAQLQYKLSFLLFSAGHLIVTGIEFIGLWALFSRFGSIRGWTIAEAALFYGIVNIIFAFSEALSRGFDILSQMIRSGEFDTILLRPRSTVIQIMGKELTLRRVGRLIQGMLVFSYAFTELGLRLSADTVFLLFIVFVNGIFFFTAIIVFQAAASFWTVESLEVFNSLSYGGVYSAQYPLDIYREYFQKFFLFVIPLGAVSYIPICTLLGKEAFPGLPLNAGYITPFAGLLFLTASGIFWRFGVRHYTSTGS